MRHKKYSSEYRKINNKYNRTLYNNLIVVKILRDNNIEYNILKEPQVIKSIHTNTNTKSNTCKLHIVVRTISL